MRRYTSIVVMQAAVHVVAPKKGNLHRSTAGIELDDAVTAFLVEHVSKGLVDGNALAARFKVVGKDRAEGLCRSILGSEADFLASSAALAKLLYDASVNETSTDARVSDGTLVVARCRATDAGGADASFVALLKLDPNDAFRAEDAVDDQGNAVVRLVLQPNILPSPRERLQKAAFVRGSGEQYDALVVDNQRRGTVVSAFFLDGFLGLEHIYDDRARTQQLYKTLHRAFDDVKDELTSDEYAQLDQYIAGQIVGGRVNVDTILENLPGSDSVRDRFTDVVGADIPDRVFDTDPDTAQALVRRRRFSGANGLSLTVPADFYQDMVNAAPPSQDSPEWIITIRTTEWTER